MNYITTYYKNLSEQLQHKLNNLQQNLHEAYVLPPSQIASERQGVVHPYRSRAQTRGRGQQRANVLGAMMSAHAYEGVNAHERDAIARIIADTQGSSPERVLPTLNADKYEYQGTNVFPMGPRQSGTQATGEHLKIALGAMRRLQNDPQFAAHHTKMIAGQLPDAMVDSAAVDAMYDKNPIGGLNRDQQNYILKKAGRSATGLSPSTRVSDITQQFGANYGTDRDTSPNAYSDYLPIDMVTRMGTEFASNQRNKTSADEYQKARAKHLKAGTYES